MKTRADPEPDRGLGGGGPPWRPRAGAGRPRRRSRHVRCPAAVPGGPRPGRLRETWPPFFEWQAHGASFAIESLEVTAGTDVAFAYALLRCGTEEEFAENPDQRLRLTVGLRKVDGRWIVTHEHHSFSDDRAEADQLKCWAPRTAEVEWSRVRPAGNQPDGSPRLERRLDGRSLHSVGDQKFRAIPSARVAPVEAGEAAIHADHPDDLQLDELPGATSLVRFDLWEQRMTMIVRLRRPR